MTYIIRLNVLDNIILTGHTNDHNITLSKVMEIFMESNLKVKTPKRVAVQFADNMDLHLRKQASTKNYDSMNENVFEEGEMETTVYLVVEHFCKSENRIIFDPEKNDEYILQSNFKNFIGYEHDFYVFCVLNKTSVMKVSNDMLIGHLAYQIHQKKGWPMIRIRMVYQGKPLDFNETIQHYGIQKDSTIYVLYRAYGRNHYVDIPSIMVTDYALDTE